MRTRDAATRLLRHILRDVSATIVGAHCPATTLTGTARGAVVATSIVAIADEYGVLIAPEPELAPILVRNQTFAGTRQCWCGTILCRYNPGPQCYIHAKTERDYRNRIAAIKQLRAAGENPLEHLC